MRSVIVVHPDFDGTWPFVADHFHKLLVQDGGAELIRLSVDETRGVSEIIPDPASVVRLISLKARVDLTCLEALTWLEEVVFTTEYGTTPEPQMSERLKERGIRCYSQPTEGFWGQSVSEFALALTLCGLRRIPQTHHEIITSLQPWDYDPPEGVGKPGARGYSSETIPASPTAP
ncbi:hypothetical protein N6H14_01860 [Paenibacillus sp. CC-CFT747]|nr:hypothetical protein N6H14_01860 [Paenibacillus sp. CC-CFT747]